jgi:hypothetical protein
MSEAMPRMTRAERLRQRARQAGNGGCFLFAKQIKAKKQTKTLHFASMCVNCLFRPTPKKTLKVVASLTLSLVLVIALIMRGD